MNIYVDESGSINNHSDYNKHFVIALVHVLNKRKLQSTFKRFVSANLKALKEVDEKKREPKMFSGNKFKEIKGSQLDREMRLKFIKHFTREKLFEVYFIEVDNSKLTNIFCQNTSRAFNYLIKLFLEHSIDRYLPNEDCILQLDERNEKTETKHFLEGYLNTDLVFEGKAKGPFKVIYFDSCNNKCIQIADVFANVYYSQLMTGNYTEVIDSLKERGIIKFIFRFPPTNIDNNKNG